MIAYLLEKLFKKNEMNYSLMKKPGLKESFDIINKKRVESGTKGLKIPFDEGLIEYMDNTAISLQEV